MSKEQIITVFHNGCQRLIEPPVELKACPFCRNNKRFLFMENGIGYGVVVCFDCDARGPKVFRGFRSRNYIEDYEEWVKHVISFWNRRAGESE